MSPKSRSASTAGACAPGEGSPSVFDAWASGPFVVTPRTLDRAISSADFDIHESLLLCIACEQFSPLWDVEGDEPWQLQVKRFPVGFPLGVLADLTGLLECDLDRAMWSLQDSRVLHRADGRSLRLNGDVAAWTHPKSGRPRLTGKILAYCLGGR